MVAAIAVLGLAIAGCKNPFTHRSSEPPTGLSGTWEVPSMPRVVISNLLFAYSERNINNFRRCLSDSFFFSAYEDSIEAEQNGQGWIYQNWDVDVEAAVTRRMFQNYPSGSDSASMNLVIDLSYNPIDQENDSTAVLVRAYSLMIVHYGALATDTVMAVGEATFAMSRSSLEGWSIDIWSDRADLDFDFDWAKFKALFR